jgi:exonuclease I
MPLHLAVVAFDYFWQLAENANVVTIVVATPLVYVSALETGQPKKCKSYLIYFVPIVFHPTPSAPAPCYYLFKLERR